MHGFLFGTFALMCLSWCINAEYDKSKAVGPCIHGRCPPNHVCSEGECFPRSAASKIFRDEKSGGIETSAKSSSAVGPCVNGLCPNGYDCIGNKCYKSQKNPVAKAIGPCVNLRCPAGYKCNLSDNQCYA